MKGLYYYYYLFYTKILPDNQPHGTVIFSLSFLLSLIVNGLINMTLAYLFGIALGKFEMIGILLVIILLMYLLLFRNGKAKRIVEKEKPKIFGSHSASIILAVLLFLIGMLFLFFEADCTRMILETR